MKFFRLYRTPTPANQAKLREEYLMKLSINCVRHRGIVCLFVFFVELMLILRMNRQFVFVRVAQDMRMLLVFKIPVMIGNVRFVAERTTPTSTCPTLSVINSSTSYHPIVNSLHLSDCLYSHVIWIPFFFCSCRHQRNRKSQKSTKTSLWSLSWCCSRREVRIIRKCWSAVNSASLILLNMTLVMEWIFIIVSLFYRYYNIHV